jgi:aminopeptidase-like protein
METRDPITPDGDLGSGVAMHALMRELFPLNRSLTGDGVRTTLAVIGRRLPLKLVDTPSGTEVFDWSVPMEWNVREAWIETPDGRRIADFAESNLHLLGYSVPVDATITLDELRTHLFTHPIDPDLVPYRTAYWADTWGFCLTQRELDRLPDGIYQVHIDATVGPGSLVYGELKLPGESEDEFLLTTYVCHPSLANDNLSGVVVLAALGEALQDRRLRHTYRLLWSPGTLGPLCWLRNNGDRLERIRHGLVVSCVGDPGPFTYKQSRRGTAEIDAAAAYVLRTSAAAHSIRRWTPLGGDERQFCSPGFNLPVGAFSRSPADSFPEYHSSADNLDFVTEEALEASLRMLLDIIDVVERNETYVNLAPYGEPQLGKRGLYRTVGGGSSTEEGLLWILSLSDGTHTLLDIATRSGLSFGEVREVADRLELHRLLQRLGPQERLERT